MSYHELSDPHKIYVACIRDEMLPMVPARAPCTRNLSNVYAECKTDAPLSECVAARTKEVQTYA